MVSLGYNGYTPSLATDVVTKGYVNALVASNLTQNVVTTAIDSAYKSIFISLPGSPGGTFTLSYGGQTTGPIAVSAPATGTNSVQSALAALTSIGAGNVSVTGVAGGPWTVTFQGTKAGTSPASVGGVGVITASGAGLTGAAYGVSVTWLAVQTYVNAQTALKASKAYIDGTGGANPTYGGDAGRLKLTQVGASGGVAPLTVKGRIPADKVTYPTTVQRYAKPFITPSAYNASSVTIADSVEHQIYTCAVADPGFAYKLLVSGMLDTSTSLDGEYTIVRVRQGSLSGPVLAIGYGPGEIYLGGKMVASYTTAGNAVCIIPSWVASLDIIVLGGGGGGGSGGFAFAPGVGGDAGSWATATVARPSIPSQVSVTVGAGGSGGTGVGGDGGDGGPSIVSGSGIATVTGVGGPASDKIPQLGLSKGKSPGNRAYDGWTYIGGGEQTSMGGNGYAPGGGAAGGEGYLTTTAPGGAGAPGAVWLFGYPINSVPFGPAALTPYTLSAQTTLTGATTLYVTASRSGTASTQTVSPLRPALYVIPVPA